MALRAVDDHPKLHALKCALHCGRGEALGYLEALWHFTGRFTPAGNIGMYPDAAIESWIEWRGDSGKLIGALIETHWLDQDEAHRLLIHDWHEHCDDATRMAVKRKKVKFATCPDVVPTCSDSGGTCSDVLGLPVPEPVPEPEPVKKSSCDEASSSPAVLTLPLANGDEFGITAERLAAWQLVYPGVDVVNQLNRLGAWLEANKTKRSTARGILKRAVNWLSRAQDQVYQNGGGSNAGNRAVQRTNGNIEAARRATEAITGQIVAWPGGSTAGGGESRDIEALLGQPC